MIITRTPYRVSFLGGGSDIASFYEKSPGAVLSTSIQQYMYITAHPSFNAKETRVKYTRTEVVEDIDDIEHPIVRAALKKLDIQGVEITSVGDIPAQTGLGSSSSFTVGLLLALHAYKGEDISKEDLAKEACEIEIDILGEPIGKQDQYAAAYGGLRQYTFKSDGTVDIEVVNLTQDKRQELEESLLLFFTGTTRSASKILKEQSESLSNDESKTIAMQQMVGMVPQLLSELLQGNVASLGDYLDKGWNIKRHLATSISNSNLNQIYEKARRYGASGGKILGAGGGGFFLLSCPKSKQNNLIAKLGLKYIPVKFDTDGATIVYRD